MAYVIMRNKDAATLRQDGKWTDFPMYGDYPGCVKVYKVLGYAIRRAKRWKPGRVVVHQLGESGDKTWIVWPEE
jgi:hypothetical protein